MITRKLLTCSCRFGWVNASYVYGLQIVNAHMKRALGAITPWDAFQKATRGEYELEDHGSRHQAAETGSLAANKPIIGSELATPHTDAATTNKAIHSASQQVGQEERRQSAAVLFDAHQGPAKDSDHRAG